MYRLRVRHFIPNPRRCFKCHKYGHIGNNCKSKEACGLCAGEKHPGECSSEQKCINCGAKHPAWSKQCPVYKREFGIQEIITKERLPYREAKRKYIELLPPMLRTFADVAGGPSKTSKKHVDKSIEQNLAELRRQATPVQHRRNSWTSGEQAPQSDPRSAKRQSQTQGPVNTTGEPRKKRQRHKKPATETLEAVVQHFDGPPKDTNNSDTDSDASMGGEEDVTPHTQSSIETQEYFPFMPKSINQKQAQPNPASSSVQNSGLVQPNPKSKTHTNPKGNNLTPPISQGGGNGKPK